MTSDKNSKYSFHSLIRFLLPVIFTIVFLYLAFKDIELNKITKIVISAPIHWIIIFSFTFLFSHLIRAFRWKFIVESIKPAASMSHLFGATMIGYGVNCAVPRLGELYRPLFLARWEDVSRSSILGTIVVERIIDILALGFSVLISVQLFTGDLYSEIVWLKSTIYIVFALMIGLIILIALVVKFKDKFYKIILKFAGIFSNRAAKFLGEVFDTLIKGFSSLSGTKNYLATIFLTAFMMFIYGLNSYIGFYMLRMNEIQDVTFSMGWILMTIAAFGVIIPTPGGTGSYHLIVIAVLVNIFNFPEEAAGAYAFLTHLISYVLFVISLLVIVYLVNKSRAAKGESIETFLSVFKLKPDEK
ncbi:MAG: lysylphosphatidylglycerol synthase transmembrane domain-containing protein [Melioribacteraceae bacterium]|nr:flippase-like domain-containing protein [Melioribacteraceae bacterium]MDD3557573.1 lysylphosphatidylglycerol synthase transmembrane domain-containing protein [Melioribacteraceae bacterium]